MILILIIAVLFAAGAVCTVCRVGEKENICNYDYMEDNEK